MGLNLTAIDRDRLFSYQGMIVKLLHEPRWKDDKAWVKVLISHSPPGEFNWKDICFSADEDLLEEIKDDERPGTGIEK